VIEIDVFEGPHAPLVIARIQFSTVSREKRFRKPAFLREEIAADQFFQLRQIALYGNPLAKIGVPQAGALPFLFKKGILHVVLVTSSSGTRWIIPKGKLEPRMTYEQVALMEAAEEAGAIGIIEPGIPALCQLDDKRPLYLYPMRVATLLPLWPDRFVRRRVVLPIYEALLRIVDVDLARAIRSLARQIPLEPTSE
jgi:8-oxo-dGTP pyrophosphatase MutT (NUDIX family)